MASYELSYVSPADPLWKRVLMRTIENLSGRMRLLPVYARWSREIANRPNKMWRTALDLIGTRIVLNATKGWEDDVPAGPLLVIANHPFGIADGIAILSLAERLGRPYRILVNADFMRVPELQDVGLPIDFSNSDAARATNIRTRVEARRWLREGGTIVMFPAGGVATAESLFGVAEELPWKQFAVRLIQHSNATVLPVHFEGQNSRLFHFVSRYSLTLRLALLVSEFRHHIGGTIHASVGAPVPLGGLNASNYLSPIDQLYVLVHRLAPAARGNPQLPRPLSVRRQYPWDVLPATPPRPTAEEFANGKR